MFKRERGGEGRPGVSRCPKSAGAGWRWGLGNLLCAVSRSCRPYGVHRSACAGTLGSCHCCALAVAMLEGQPLNLRSLQAGSSAAPGRLLSAGCASYLCSPRALLRDPAATAAARPVAPGGPGSGPALADPRRTVPLRRPLSRLRAPEQPGGRKGRRDQLEGKKVLLAESVCSPPSSNPA